MTDKPSAPANPASTCLSIKHNSLSGNSNASGKTWGKASVAALFLTIAGCATTPEESTELQPEPAPVVVEAPKPAPPPEPIIVDRSIPADAVYPLLVAEFALNNQQPVRALGHYLEQAHNTQDVGLATIAAKLARNLKEYRATLDAALLWAELQPNNTEPRMLAAEMFTRTGQPRQAMEQMAQIRQLGGKPDYALIVATTLTQPDDIRAELLLDINDLLAQTPDDAELLVGKAILQHRSGRADDALATIGQALAIQPDNIRAITLEARWLISSNQKSKAFTRFEQQLAQNPDNLLMRHSYARFLTSVDLQRAEQQFEILMQHRQNDGYILYSLARIKYQHEKTDEAKALFQQLLQINKRVDEAHLFLGRIEEQAGNNGAAQQHYRSITRGQTQYEAVRGLVRLFIKNDDPEGAQQVIIDARQTADQNRSRLYLLESDLLNRQRLWQESHAVLSEGLEEFPEDGNIRYARAMISDRQGNFAEMEQDLRLILDSDPNNATALNALGYSLADRGEKLDEALDMIHRALLAKPDDPAVLDSMGWVRYRLGQLDSALEYLQQAFAILADPEIGAHLGEVLWQLDRQDDARNIWQALLEKHPDSQPVVKTLKQLGIELPAPTSDASTSAASDTNAVEPSQSPAK